MALSNWQKFRLLLWKNFILQWRHKAQWIFEVVVPLVLIIIMVCTRNNVETIPVQNNILYPPVDLSSLTHLKTQSDNKINKWQLVYTPTNEVFHDLLKRTITFLELEEGTVKGVDNEKLLYRHVVQEQSIAGIVFKHKKTITKLPKHLTYTIRFPGELRTEKQKLYREPIDWKTNLLFPRIQRVGPRNMQDPDGGVPPGYWQEGFLAIQNAIANSYHYVHSGKQMPALILQRYPYPPHLNDRYINGLTMFLPLVILTCFVYPFINTIKFVGREKENQLKETMKMMGLPNWLHWLAWFTRTMLNLSITISMIVFLFKIRWYKISDVAILTNTDWTVLWIFLFVYMMATTTFSFMISVFFSNANTAAAVGALVWFINFSPYYITTVNRDSYSQSLLMFICLLSNSGMGHGMNIIILYEGTGEGLNWNNMWQPVSIDDNISAGAVMIMLLIATILYMIVTLYVEQLLPGEFGIPKRWYFPFTKRFCCPKSVKDTHGSYIKSMSLVSDDFEEDPSKENAGIEIKKLRKVFHKKKVAVEGLTLNMYKDQITVLLGHNGAGKSTTMSMISGMFPPTSGTAYINGFDIRTDMTGVHDSLGLCPQHNVLFDELTVTEHITFYCKLRGCDQETIYHEVKKFLKLIDLEDKADQPSSTLSGGMKRKLSVCVAFCGDSKVVLCDEPTAGMDPVARRALWDFLREMKRGRTILISTHFMDEADVLGDRIAIMANGQLKCSGSPYFLKKRFGVGYHLIIVKQHNCDSKKITSLLAKHIHDIRVESEIGSELTYLLRDNNTKSFKHIFEDLEKNLVLLNIESYGITLTTLEDVFMKVGADHSNVIEEPIMTEADRISTMLENLDHENQPSSFVTPEETYPLISGVGLFRNQVEALIRKKILQTFRAWIFILMQMLIPLVIMSVVVLGTKGGSLLGSLPAMHITLHRYKTPVTILEHDPFALPFSFEERLAKAYKKIVQKDADNGEFKSIATGIQDYVLKIYVNLIAYASSHYMVGATIKNNSTITAWFNNQAYHTTTLSIHLLHNAIILTNLGPDYKIDLSNHPFDFTEISQIKQLENGESVGFEISLYIPFAFAFAAAFYVVPYVRERECGVKLLQLVSGTNVVTFWITSFTWDYMIYIVNIVLITILFIIFQEKGWSKVDELGKVFYIFLSFGFAILPATYVSSLFFHSSSSAFTRMTVIYLITGFGLFFTINIIKEAIPGLEQVTNSLINVFSIFPHFTLSSALNNYNVLTNTAYLCESMKEEYKFTQEQICIYMDNCCNLDHFQWAAPGIGKDILFMVSIGIACFILLFLLEYKVVLALIYIIKTRFQEPFKPTSQDLIDFDVQQEKNLVAGMSRSDIESYNLVLKDMTKLYGKKVVVNQLSLVVDKSECFGLLGINGAGKTTTFRMLTGDVKIAYGQAWVRGNSVKTEINRVNKFIGYCPQYDALFDNLTGKETLYFFCYLRGLARKSVRATTIQLATMLDFIQHIDKRVQHYSGGNKRKLSTAIALIGSPAVIYLDEPTTGMDPGTKRHLWNVISKVRNSGKSIVLTSHSMEECEALCTRMAIMVNGQFMCIGSSQHLKSRFSEGITLIIKTTKNANMVVDNIKKQPKILPSAVKARSVITQLDLLKEFVATQFPDSELEEEFQGLLTYYIPNENIKWSVMFGLMEKAKEDFELESYSFSQTTLEQVFLSFTKYQLAHHKKRKNPPK